MTQPPDDAALVARLRKEADSPDYQAGDGMDWCQVDANLLREAATALEAKDRQIARLEQVLANVKLGNLPVMPTDEQRAIARASDLYKRGDMRLMWVSESDLCMVEMAPMFAALEPSDKGVGKGE